jgi:ubiquinone/menaquinone biosynthesis C-methylase UbiE
MTKKNIDIKTVDGFGKEWERFDQAGLDPSEQKELFGNYFHLFPWERLTNQSIGFDMGCGSGRWANLVAKRVGTLHCIDPSSALSIAQKNLSNHKNCIFHSAGVGDGVLPEETMDFGYSLGVLHHVPNTFAGISECVKMLKPGAPFLLYLYYAFDNKPVWFKCLWKCSDLVRYVISSLPFILRFWTSQLIALVVYYPLARSAKLAEKMQLDKNLIELMPLAIYRNLSFYTMRTDALDRFGTRLEQRFTKLQIFQMMELAGLKNIKFSEIAPYWCAIGYKNI